MYINHIAFVLDESSSMSGLRKKTLEVFNNQIDNLKRKSESLGQETRISVYTFADQVNCIAFDIDINRFKNIDNQYLPSGMTALLDGAGKTIKDLAKIPQIYGDHAFLLYVITDGEENKSRTFTSASLKDLISYLDDNWTVSCLVPNIRGKHEATKYGFPKNNIEIWETSEQGLEEVERKSVFAVNNYLTLRSQGIRSTTAFYSNLSDVKIKDAEKVAKQLKPTEFTIFAVNKSTEIKNFVEAQQNGMYIKGQAFYQLTKPETIQGYKQIAVRNRKNGKVFSEGARNLLGLPLYDLKVSPGNHGDWDIFIQSTSTNRKLFPGSDLLVLKAGR